MRAFLLSAFPYLWPLLKEAMTKEGKDGKKTNVGLVGFFIVIAILIGDTAVSMLKTPDGKSILGEYLLGEHKTTTITDDEQKELALVKRLLSDTLVEFDVIRLEKDKIQKELDYFKEFKLVKRYDLLCLAGDDDEETPSDDRLIDRASSALDSLRKKETESE